MKCIFCLNDRSASAEHVIPKWVSRALARDPRGMPPGATLEQGDRRRRIPASGVLGLTMRDVCVACNTGWMNGLERRARPQMTRLMSDQPTDINTRGQRALAAWAAKTAMVGRYAVRPANPVDPEWLKAMHDAEEPPAGWYVWLTRYVGVNPLRYYGDSGPLNFPEAAGRPTPNTVIMTLVMGYLAIKVLGIYDGMPAGPGGTPVAIPQIWPVEADLVTWPPPTQVDDSTLGAFEQMFIGPAE